MLQIHINDTKRIELWTLNIPINNVESMIDNTWCTLILPGTDMIMEDNPSIEMQCDISQKLTKALSSVGDVQFIIFSKETTFIGISQKQIKDPVSIVKQEKSAPRVNRTGWGGGGRIKTKHRFSVLRMWLEYTFGSDFLRQGCGVLDIAGGKGDLSFQLVNFAGIPATIVDPRPMDIANMLKSLKRSYVQRLLDASTDGKRIRIPFPDHIRAFFWHTNSRPKVKSNYANDTLVDIDQDSKVLQNAIQNCSILVGMHADEATESIVDWGLELRKPFAVIPCCIFPNMFHHRNSIRTHESFCTYLVAKDSTGSIQHGTLAFPGRNDVIYLKNK